MNWLSQNYQWVFSGIGVLIIGFFLNLWRRSSRPKGSLTAQGASVAKSPVASGSGITQTVSETHHHYYPENPVEKIATIGSMTREISVSNEVAPQKEEKEDVPLISFIQPKETQLGESQTVWHEAVSHLESSLPALLAEFKNMPKELGKRTTKASSVIASLVFTGEGISEELHISHGTWLNQITHYATFESGISHHLVIAVKYGNPFVTFDNPRSADPFRKFRSGMTINSVKTYVLPAHKGQVRITLIDGYGWTVFDGSFDYLVSLDGMFLTQRNTS